MSASSETETATRYPPGRRIRFAWRPFASAIGIALVAASAHPGFATVQGNAPASARDETTPAEPAAPSELGWMDATVLGLVEGLTEYLPISSTGHLILANHLLGLDRDVPATDGEGQPLWRDSVDGGDPAPFTIKGAIDSYTVLIQVGAIAAVVVIYWRTLLGVAAGIAGRNPAGLRLLRNLIIAFLPAGAAGFFLHDWIDEHLFSVQVVIVALVVGAVVMWLADRWQRRRLPPTLGPEDAAQELTPSELSVGQALLIGVLQCASLWPGMSRSMVTIVGGYLAGLRPSRAAEFSFLLGLPTLTGAAVLTAAKTGSATVATLGWPPVLWGCVVAAVAAAIAVRGLVAYLNRHGLGVFAVYRIVLAAVFLWWLQ